MKTFFAIIGILAFTGIIISFQSSDERYGDKWKPTINYNIDIPLKQHDIVVTKNEKRVKYLIKMGYVVEDVDVVMGNNNRDYNIPSKFYTLIKY
jgi:hypothetical protein